MDQGICWIAVLHVMICVSQAACLLAEVINYSLFMINRDNSVFWCHLVWLLHPWAMRSSYWLSPSPTLHFVSVSGSLRDRRARQSYKVKYLGLALALQVSVIILLEAFLLCWIIMEVRVYACHLFKCGWRKPTRGAGQRNVCFSVMSFEERSTKANWHCFLSRDDAAQQQRCSSASHATHGSGSFQLLVMWQWNMFSGGDNVLGDQV